MPFEQTVPVRMYVYRKVGVRCAVQPSLMINLHTQITFWFCYEIRRRIGFYDNNVIKLNMKLLYCNT